ncbi:MAG TPA: VIT family protein [Aeromonadales bacterium]|nr:VIT family protein [Aeromonadales bacterium]
MIETHFNERIGWLRAAVLGANDGIVSTSSLVVGIAAANTGRSELLIAAIAGLIAGAMSMAAGEYVSVSSQSDTEKADLDREKYELANFDKEEHEELANIYVTRGLDKELAVKVADQLMAHNALEAHSRDELGLSEIQKARPIQAALSSAASFTIGALLPVMLVAFAPLNTLILTVSISSLFFLGILGSVAAYFGGANITKGALRVTFWGALAMGVTAVIGHIFGTIV